MVAFEEMRARLVAAFDAANSSMIGDRSYARCVRGLPALDEPDAVAAWLYAVAGGDGSGGLLRDVKVRLGRGGTPEEMRAWIEAWDLLLGLRSVLCEMPAKASCGADCVSGCSACDGEGVVFEEVAA